MNARDPKSAHPLALDKLTDDEWEELTYLVAWTDDRRVERLKAPDGGLDTVLPDPSDSETAERGWQAKRYPGPINWGKCEESLDRAVELWKVKRVTFTFPRDLTRGQRTTFSRRLENRHQGVSVDYLGGSWIRARLAADEAGERIAQRFYGHQDPIAVMERAMTAGGKLSKGSDAVDREFAVSEFEQGADPHFQWVIVKGREGDPEPPRAEGAAMRLQFRKGDLRMWADAVPRGSSSTEHYGPKVRVVADDSPEGKEAARLLAELAEGGGRLQLREGVKVALERLPRPFGEVLDEPLQGEMTLKLVPIAEPWFARLEVASEDRVDSIDLDLVPQDPDPEWDNEWKGGRGGLELRISTRWSVNDARGESKLGLRFGPTNSPTGDRTAALRTMVALHGAGIMRLVDRTGVRLALESHIEERPIQREMVELADLTNSLWEIEQFCGRPMPSMPDEIQLRDIDRLRQIADLVRAGGEGGMLRESTMVGSSKTVEGIKRSGSDIEIREQVYADIFGEQIHVGERITRLPRMTIKQAVRTSGGANDEWRIELQPANSDQAWIWLELRPPSEEEQPGDG